MVNEPRDRFPIERAELPGYDAESVTERRQKGDRESPVIAINRR